MNVQESTLKALQNLQPRDCSKSTVLGSNSVFDRIVSCALEFISRKHRTQNPSGHFDSANRFFLEKRCDCCVGIRSPSRSYPYSEMVHGRTLVHVASEFDVEQHIKVIRKIARTIEKESMGAALKLLEQPKFIEEVLAVDLGV